MKFRQRIAWLIIIIYLSGTFAFLYYVFEINEHFNRFALEHNNNYHLNNGGKRLSLMTSFWHHLADVPLQIWILILLLPYLQIFAFILAWTRTEPKLSIAYVWPAVVYCHLQKVYKKLKRFSHKSLKSSSIGNGYVVIDT